MSVTDLSSTNGTFVNGKRITRSKELEDGDLIAFGSERVIYRLKANKQSAKLPSIL